MAQCALTRPRARARTVWGLAIALGSFAAVVGLRGWAALPAGLVVTRWSSRLLASQVGGVDHATAPAILKAYGVHERDQPRLSSSSRFYTTPRSRSKACEQLTVSRPAAPIQGDN